jgi:hypothetical protein
MAGFFFLGIENKKVNTSYAKIIFINIQIIVLQLSEGMLFCQM